MAAQRDQYTADIQAPFDANDPAQVEHRNNLINLAEHQRLLGWLRVKQHLLSTPEGRSWCWNLMQSCKVFEGRMPMTGSPYEQGYFNGEQQRGLGLMRVLAQADATNFALMLAENDTLPKVEAGNG